MLLGAMFPDFPGNGKECQATFFYGHLAALFTHLIECGYEASNFADIVPYFNKFATK